MDKIEVFEIDGALCDLNTYINKERMNKFAAASIKKKMTEKCIKAARNLPLNYFDKIYLTFTWVCKDKKKDPDNIAFAKKFILDGLVRAKVIANDGWNNIIGFKDEFFCEPKEEERVIITIEECINGKEKI